MSRDSVNKIAIFRALYLGDMLCVIPTVRAIRAAFPAAQISLVGLPWQQDLVRRFPDYFDRLICFPGWPGLPEQPVKARQIVPFVADMQREAFDLIFQLQGNGALTNAMCVLWDGRKVAGLRKAGEYAPEPELFPVSEDGEHEVLRFLKVCDCMGIPRQGTHLEFRVLEEEKIHCSRIIERAGLANRRYVCVHPGARDPKRRWPAEKFGWLANAIAHRGYTPVLTGSGEEKTLLREVAARVGIPVVNIVEDFGHLSAGELAALMQGSDLLVSNDTGVSHLAAALHLPSVIVFSPYSDIERWRPLDSATHVAIPFAEADDVQQVWRVTERLLTTSASNRADAAVAGAN